MNKYHHAYTTQVQLRKAFWRENPQLSKKKVKGDYLCDTRVAFTDFLDSIHGDSLISDALVQRATL